MHTLSELDLSSAWDWLSPEMKSAIGNLLIKEHVLRFAAGTYEGDEAGTGIAYLEPGARDEAEREADEIALEITGLLHAEFPDLFGRCPTPEHPNGTDPVWAEPITFQIEPQPQA